MIYFDNAATTWPKPISVTSAMMQCMREFGANPGRSGHQMSLLASEHVYRCREQISTLFKLDNPANVIFTPNATYGLNMVIKGVLNKGDHVICTQMDHNSVLRAIYSLENIEVSVASADKNGYVSSDKIEAYIKPNTKLIVMTHVSNVCGTIMPITEIFAIAKKHGILTLIDASQSAGVIDICLKKSDIDFLVCPGHKALFGPMGTGIVCINSSIPLRPLVCGGTGSYSGSVFQPEELPDRFESGTLNLPGICGLYEGIKYVQGIGIKYILEHELKLTSFLINAISEIKHFDVVGQKDTQGRTGVVSIVHKEKDSTEVANILSSEYNIAVRALYHCAYKAHEALGTEQSGTVRISLSFFSNLSEIKTLLYALEHI